MQIGRISTQKFSASRKNFLATTQKPFSRSTVGSAKAESDTRTWAAMDSDHPPSSSCGGGAAAAVVSPSLSRLYTPPRQPFANRIIPRHPPISQTMNERARAERSEASEREGGLLWPFESPVEECLPSIKEACLT